MSTRRPSGSRLRGPILGVFALIALLLCTAGASAQEGQTIQDVILQGDAGVDEALLRANMRTRAGTPFSRSIVDEDTRWMHDTHGILAEVRIEPGPVVRFVLSRISRYDSVGFEGITRYGESELLGVARLDANRDARPDQIAAGRDLVRDHYLRAGYAFVQVDTRSRTDADGRRIMMLRVFEGPQVETTDVLIEGLTALRPKDALGVMRSPPGFWAWLLGKDFVRAELDTDLLLLENFVRGEGYLDGRVGLKRLDWNDERDEVLITMLVDEGPRYAVRSLRVEGNTAFSDEELLVDGPVVVGGPWREPDVRRMLRRMTRLYGELGFIDARIEADYAVDETTPELDVVFRIVEGNAKTIRDVIIRGNTGTRDDVIRRYLTFGPGDTVNTSELAWSEDLLISLDYFTDFAGSPQVNIETEPTPEPDMVDVVVDVNDEESGLFTFLVGAGSDSGLFGGASINKRNFDITRAPSSFGEILREFFGTGEAFHGGGQRLFFEVLPGTETTEVDIVFQDPWLNPASENPWGLTVELYDRLRRFEDYDRSGTGLAVTFDHKLNRNSSVSIGLRHETTDISDVNAAMVPTIAMFAGKTTSMALELGYDYEDLDSVFEPTDGFVGGLRLETAGNGLGGDTDLVRIQATGEWFIPIGEDDEGHVNVLHPRFAIGHVDPTGDTKVLPFFENFFVGGTIGPFGMRGFDFQGVGPHEPLSSDALGGQAAMVASVEALFPLVSQYNPFRDEDETLVKGVVFVDVGNVVPNGSLSKLTSNLRVAAGAGVRLRLPALGGITLALDVAAFTADQTGDETRAISFEMSRRF
ncbi:MAG: BamA/OMP85 family outer membrane protein [Planctomycetota bacterium]